MSQPVTVRRYHIVADEHTKINTHGYHETKKDEVEREAERTGRLVAVTASSGSGWREISRYDPSEGGETNE